MYIPAPFAFRGDDPAPLFEIIERHPFALLVATIDGRLEATHLPIVLDRHQGPFGTLLGHVARPNPASRALVAGDELLLVFSGPNAYISPDWYESHAQVPTWNYVAVHAYGRPRVLDYERSIDLLERLSARHEHALLPKKPWTLDKVPERTLRPLVERGITAFSLEVERLEGKRKLSQNKPAADRIGAFTALRALDDPGAVAVADLMAAEER